MNLPPQQPNKSSPPSPPQSQAYASNLPECNAINFGAVEAVLTPTATMLVDGLNLDVDGVIERLLETPGIRENHRTQLRRPLYWCCSHTRHELQSPLKAKFPSEIPKDISQFTSFNESTYDKGFNSEGEQCFFMDELIVNSRRCWCSWGRNYLPTNTTACRRTNINGSFDRRSD